jgi:hypothetical protein
MQLYGYSWLKAGASLYENIDGNGQWCIQKLALVLPHFGFLTNMLQGPPQQLDIP